MLILSVLEIALAVLIVAGLITQIIIPLFRGTPLFPVLNKSGIETRLQSAKQEVRIAEMEKEIERLKAEAVTTREKKGDIHEIR